MGIIIEYIKSLSIVMGFYLLIGFVIYLLFFFIPSISRNNGDSYTIIDSIIISIIWPILFLASFYYEFGEYCVEKSNSTKK